MQIPAPTQVISKLPKEKLDSPRFFGDEFEFPGLKQSDNNNPKQAKYINSYSGRRESSPALIDSPKPHESTRALMGEHDIYVEEFKDDIPKRQMPSNQSVISKKKTEELSSSRFGITSPKFGGGNFISPQPQKEKVSTLGTLLSSSSGPLKQQQQMG